MPAAVANSTTHHRPAKKAKLAQSPPAVRQNGLHALANGNAAKPTAKLNGVRNAKATHVDDSTATVAHAGDVQMADVIEISSQEESEDETSDDDHLTHPGGAEAAPTTNGHVDGEDEDEDEEEEGAEADAEDLTFGDRLRAEASEPVQESRIVNVENAFADDSNTDAQALATTRKRPLAAPNANSLGTVLTQALRTNDKELLESCLSVIDVDSVYATVERLPSPLVGTLLQRLAERLHKTPGRAGMLMAWVQWSLAAHGGYLASQPQLVKQLAALNKVLKERSSGLMPLMSLKGRLDMLQAQLDLRKRNQQRAAEDDDGGVIYIEGQDDYVSSEDEEEVDGGALSSRTPKRLRRDVEDDEESSMDDMPLNMEMDDDDEGSEGSDDDDLLDLEAEETDDDVGDDSEPESEDLLDDAEAASDSEEESKPERRSTAARAGLKSRR